MGYFLPFNLSNSPRNQNFTKMKKTPGDIIILHMCIINYHQVMYSSWYMVHDRCNYNFSFWAIFCPLPPISPKRFWKNEKNAWRYYHFACVYYKLWSDDVWFLRYAVRQTNRQKKWHNRGGCPTEQLIKEFFSAYFVTWWTTSH